MRLANFCEIFRTLQRLVAHDLLPTGRATTAGTIDRLVIHGATCHLGRVAIWLGGGAVLVALLFGRAEATDVPRRSDSELAPDCAASTERAWPSETWSVALPVQRCLDGGRLAAAVAFAQAKAGGAGIIVRAGKRVGGWGSPDQSYPSASAAKTGTTGLAAILARGDGLFDDQTVAQPFAPHVPSPTLTLRQLLTMTSGLSHNKCDRFIAREGTWVYSNCGMNYAADALGALVGGLERYLRTRVYDRIGARVTWDHSPPHGDVGLDWSVSDAARLMLLFLRHGEWKGEQLLDPVEIDRATRIANPDAPFAFPEMYIHRGRKPPAFYGTGFWLNRGSIMPGVPEDLVVGMGAFSCRDEFFMAYSRSLDLVVVRAGRSLREGRCKALHFQGNEDFMRKIVEAVLTP